MEKVNIAGGLLLVFGDCAATQDATADASAASVVRRAQAGDREAFGELYARYGAMVHGILLARVPHSEVDDLLQEVFFIAYRRLDALRDARTFGGWLATIARNRAHDYHRAARPTEQLNEHTPAPAAPSTEALEILSLLHQLPEAYRETLVLRLVEGMSGNEIAQLTGLTPASVRVNLHRGMRHLREALRATHHNTNHNTHRE